MVCSSGSCVQDLQDCPGAEGGTVYAGCRTTLLPNSYEDTGYYCSNKCVLCNTNYLYNSGTGQCEYQGTPTSCSSFTISPSYVDSSNSVQLTVSGCTGNSPLRLHYDFRAYYGNTCSWSSNNGPSTLSSKTVTFSVQGCPDADDNPVSFSVDVYNEGIPGHWYGIKSSYVCLNPNQQWNPGYGCCWTTQGNSCSNDNDCCGSNYCSNSHCCGPTLYWDGSHCSDATDEIASVCTSLGGTWDGTSSYVWTNGNPYCVLGASGEYMRQELYYGSTMPDGGSPLV